MKKTLLCTLLSLSYFTSLLSQCLDGFLPNGQRCGGTVQTAVPFLRIVPDARTAAMGDAGIAITPDANAILYNASKLVMAKKNWGSSLDYAPWLTGLEINDINLFHAAHFLKLGQEKKQAIGFSMRYFSLGRITYTDFNAQPIGEAHPYEWAFTTAYSRRLSDEWAIGAAAKYIYSDLTGGINHANGISIQAGKALAFDVSATYKKPLRVADKPSYLTLGMAVSNIGNKISYVRSQDFLPANLGMGGAWELDLAEAHKVMLTVEFNKLLVPTPNPLDSTGVWRTKSVFKGAIESFSDAPGGISEELREITTSVAMEYWYEKALAVRMGYFYEDKLKGNRKYFTLGLGVRGKIFGLNFSYLLPTTSERSPLANTWHLSLLLNGAPFQ